MVIPAAAHNLFSASHRPRPHTFVVLFAAELIGSRSGSDIIIRRGVVAFDLMFAGIVCFAVLGFVSDRILLAGRARVLKGQMLGTEEQVVR